MRKLSVILVAMVLVLAIGQSVFAKGSVELTIGYNDIKGAGVNYHAEPEPWHFDDNGFKIDLFGNYYLTDRFSLAGRISIAKISHNVDYEKYEYQFDKNPEDGYDYLYKITKLNLSLFGRYDIFKSDIANVGIQVGFTSNTDFWVPCDEDHGSYWHYKYNEFISFVALGMYGDFYLTPKLNIYIDLSFPIGFWTRSMESFSEIFIYDSTFGATYEISPNINLGIEGNISNATIAGTDSALKKKWDEGNGNDPNKNKYFNFSVGAKMGYSF